MKARVVTVPVGSLLPGLSIYRPEDRLKRMNCKAGRAERMATFTKDDIDRRTWLDIVLSWLPKAHDQTARHVGYDGFFWRSVDETGRCRGHASVLNQPLAAGENRFTLSEGQRGCVLGQTSERF
jgi:hypothetical protein